MKGGFSSLAMLLVAVSVVGRADAQESVQSFPAAVAVESQPIPAAAPTVIVSAQSNVALSGVPLAASADVGVSNANGSPATPFSVQEAEGGLKGFFFGSRRRTSNTLMIGGVALAGIGVGVVKGDVGALLGIAGLLSSIGGLYLAF
jgi:hypothetical protein